jgi:hypothetical protein
MARSRSADADAGPADARMAAYLEGRHHLHQALALRVAYLPMVGGPLAGYIGGHLTGRFARDGEVEYAYVPPAYRRTGLPASCSGGSRTGSSSNGLPGSVSTLNSQTGVKNTIRFIWAVTGN